jgi:hypothetical protein
MKTTNYKAHIYVIFSILSAFSPLEAAGLEVAAYPLKIILCSTY